MKKLNKNFKQICKHVHKTTAFVRSNKKALLLSPLILGFFFSTSLSDNFSLSVVISNYNINPPCISYSCGCSFKLNQKRTINMFSFCETNACLGVTLCKNQLLDSLDYYIILVLHLWLSANCFVLLLFILQLENNFSFSFIFTE